MNDLECLNCHAPTPAKEGKLFEGVFCCEICHQVATSTSERLQKELKMLMTMCTEAIRVSLVQGKLHLKTGPRPEVSKAELLRSMIGILEDKS